MKRTQLYLEDDAWKALHVRSKISGLSISELVRQAIRERYLSPAGQRREAMQAFAGIWRDRPEMNDVEKYVRRLRRGKRLDQLAK
jgi:hypothetical protein